MATYGEELAAKRRVLDFLDARSTMSGHNDDEILHVWVRGEQHILFTADVRLLAERIPDQ